MGVNLQFKMAFTTFFTAVKCPNYSIYWCPCPFFYWFSPAIKYRLLFATIVIYNHNFFTTLSPGTGAWGRDRRSEEEGGHGNGREGSSAKGEQIFIELIVTIEIGLEQTPFVVFVYFFLHLNMQKYLLVMGPNNT